MRIIHTSDWHLGQTFYTQSRLTEHQHFLRWLLEQVVTYQVDAIIVAGDIFDIGSPPSYAREMYHQFVVDLQKTGCALLILGGNHDSVMMLNETKSLLSCLNTQVIARGYREERLIDDQLIVINDRSGQAGAIVCAIPFLRPRDLMISFAGQTGDEKQIALQEAITQHYHTLYQKAVELQKTFPTPLPILATGHLMVAGSHRSESVRDLYVGTLNALPISCLPPADYIALGHIHRAQSLTSDGHIRYSGSPIPLSFDEAQQEKSVVLLDFHHGTLAQLELLQIPITQPLRALKGNVSSVLADIETLTCDPESPPLWLDIEIQSDDYITDLHHLFLKATQDRPIEIIRIRRTTTQPVIASAATLNESLSELTPHEIFTRRLQEAHDLMNDTQTRERIETLFTELLFEIDAPVADRTDSE